jgi:hypothetical protein
MLTIDDIPIPPKEVFGLATPSALFRKFAWERDRLQIALAPENNKFPAQEPLYIAFNCAVTAWHLADWVWQSANDEQRAMLEERLAFKRTGNERTSLHAFNDALGKDFPQLAACREFANGSKHFLLNNPKEGFQAEAGYAFVVEPGTGRFRGEAMLQLHVHLPNQNMSAMVFFNSLLVYWNNILAMLGMHEAAKCPDDGPKPPDWLQDYVASKA